MPQAGINSRARWIIEWASGEFTPQNRGLVWFVLTNDAIGDLPMDIARASRIAEWAFVVAVGLVHVVIFCWAERADQPNFLVAAAHDAQLLSAIVLILAWAVLGPGWVWVRGGALPLLVAMWFLPWNTRMFPRETTASFPIAVAASAAMIVVCLRICRLRVVPVSNRCGPERGAQFSILAMLIATTLIAAAVGLLESLRPILSGNIEGLSHVARYVFDTVEDVLRAATIRSLVGAAAVAGAAVGGIWVVLRPGAMWVRAMGLAVGLGVLGVYLPHLRGIPAEEFRGVAINLAFNMAAVAALAGVTALPLRLMDYRLQRPAKAANPAVAAPTTEDGSRVRHRVAAVLGLLILVCGGIPLAHWLQRRYAESLQSPTQAFARWAEPQRPSPWIIEIRTITTHYRTRLVDFDLDGELDISFTQERPDAEAAVDESIQSFPPSVDEP